MGPAEEARGMVEVAERLADILGAAPAEVPTLTPFEPGAPPKQVAAVDGSSVTLAEAGRMMLVAYRAGWVGLSDGKPVRVGPLPPQVELLGEADDGRVLRERLKAAGVGDEVIVPKLPPSSVLDHLRTLEELIVAQDALELLHEGDLLLLDGALQVRATLPLLDRLLARAIERGVDVVGVCKSTSITIGAVPALAACQLAGRRFDAPTWYAPLLAPPNVRGRTVAARLSPGEERVFRFDIVAPDEDVARVLARLAALSGHPAYPGYPSPLAMAHNAVVLSEDVRRRLRGEVMDAAVRAGVGESAWDAAFLDYHDILEMGV